MAVLASNKLALFRQLLARNEGEVTWVKADVNAAAQALEDWWETTARGLAGAEMESAAPGKFSNAQKKLIGKFWLEHKFGEGG